MKYSANGDTVKLEMSRGEYANLTLAIGIAAGVAHRETDKKVFWGWIDFANRLNEGNPNFVPYEIPEEFKEPHP